MSSFVFYIVSLISTGIITCGLTRNARKKFKWSCIFGAADYIIGNIIYMLVCEVAIELYCAFYILTNRISYIQLLVYLLSDLHIKINIHSKLGCHYFIYGLAYVFVFIYINLSLTHSLILQTDWLFYNILCWMWSGHHYIGDLWMLSSFWRMQQPEAENIALARS